MAKRKVPLTRFPDAVAVSYNRAITKMVRELGKETLKMFDQHIERQIELNRKDKHDFIVDGFFDVFKSIFQSFKNKASKTFSSKRKEDAAGTFLASLNQFNKSNMFQQGRIRGIDPTKTEPWLNNFMKAKVAENVNYITKIQDDYVEKIEEIIETGVKGGTNPKVIRNQLVERIGMTESRAQFIAVDQAGSILGQMTAKRHQQMGVEKFKWLTSKDERVRESHRELSDMVFTYDDPPEVGLPGEDYRCRCVAIPVFDDD
ncbi:phage head morphogenesis protein [Psychrobacillus sp. FSL K6-1415]|uniref:phage head morphogenesis protein n=1 Tax=Psychrobacillus sp. FSL K6-1415 TaxID=2921544 RepID=UPI0030F6702D